MKLSNNSTHYGLVSILLHWITALLVLALFGLGLWMTSLSYYDPWYRTGPDLHRSFGVVAATLFIVRGLWRLYSPLPHPHPHHANWEKRLAALTHRAFYLLMALIVISGYLISTADGRAISVFGLFELPALLNPFENQEDTAGAAHLWLAWTLIGLVVLHALGALKHQWIERDGTLTRMFRPATNEQQYPSNRLSPR